MMAKLAWKVGEKVYPEDHGGWSPRETGPDSLRHFG
jgi:hypothetical protein